MSNVLMFSGGAILLGVVLYLKRRVAGGKRPPIQPDLSWERMSEMYGADGLSAKDVFEKIGGKLGRGYTGVGGDAEGLILWHPGHRGARIPWPDVTLVPGTYMGAPAFRVEAVKTADITIVIPRRFEDRLKSKAGSAWPGLSPVAAPEVPGSDS